MLAENLASSQRQAHRVAAISVAGPTRAGQCQRVLVSSECCLQSSVQGGAQQYNTRSSKVADEIPHDFHRKASKLRVCGRTRSLARQLSCPRQGKVAMPREGRRNGCVDKLHLVNTMLRLDRRGHVVPYEAPRERQRLQACSPGAEPPGTLGRYEGDDP